MAKYVRSYKIRFEDCDVAGIVFYPRYILMLNRLVEDWFTDALALPWGVMHRERKLGVPTVNLNVAFKKPSRLDDLLEWSLEVRKLGARSLTIGVTVSCDGEERLMIEMVAVSVNLVADGIALRDIPDDLRSGMEGYLVDPK